MSLIQKLFRLLSTKAAFSKMEEESRKWRYTCPCGNVFSIWEIGGIRYRAAGNPRNVVTCPACGKSQWLAIRHEDRQ